MSLRKSKELQRVERQWIGKRVRYYLMTLYRDGRLEGPYTGIVEAVTTNEAIIEDRLEGCNHRHAISFTGELIIKPDDGSRMDEFANADHAEIIET